MASEAGRLRLADGLRRLARLAFGLMIVLSPFQASFLLAARPIAPLYGAYTDFLLAWSEVALLATLGLWVASLAAVRRPVRLGPRFLRWPIAGLLACAWIAVPWSIDPALSAWNALHLVLLAGLALYALNEIASLGRIALPLALMVSVQAIVGIAQVASQGSLGLAALGERNLDPALNGVSVVASSTADRLLRAYGLADHPNILGGVLAFALPLLAAALADGRRGARVVAGLAFGVGSLALLVTFSRAAWLALGVALALGLLMLAWSGLRRATRAWAGAAAGAALMGAILLVPYGRYVLARVDVLSPTTVTELMSTGERSILIRAASAVVASHPVTGTGPGTLPEALLRSEPGLTFDFQPAPVVMLDVAAEAGLLAALFYGAIVIGPWVALARRRRRWTLDLVALSAALAASTIVGLLDYYTWSFPPGRIWSWLLLGLWARAYASAMAPRPVTGQARG